MHNNSNKMRPRIVALSAVLIGVGKASSATSFEQVKESKCANNA